MTSVTEDVTAVPKLHSDKAMWGMMYLTAAVCIDIKVAVWCALHHR
jgi:hypothetical protein